MREGAGPPLRVGDADPAEHVDGDGERGLARHLVVDAVRLGDLRAHGVERVHRGERVLEDHGDLLAAPGPHPILGQGVEVGAVEQYLAGDLCPALLEEAHQRLAGDGLAGAGLADEADGLAPVQGEVHAVDGVHEPVIGGEGDVQVAYTEQGLLGGGGHQAALTRGSMTA